MYVDVDGNPLSEEEIAAIKTKDARTDGRFSPTHFDVAGGADQSVDSESDDEIMGSEEVLDPVKLKKTIDA